MQEKMPDAWEEYIIHNKSQNVDPNNTHDHEGWPVRPAIFGGEYVYYFSTIKIALSADDLRDIWSKMMAASPAEQDHVKFLREVIDNRIRGFGKWANIVSLGTDCLPRTVATRWGLKRPRALGEQSHPFDLSITPIGSVTAILETSFADFLDELRYDSELGYPVHGKYGIWFNHEAGEAWAENDFSKFRSRYANRIRNFEYALCNGTHTILVIHITSPLDHTLLELTKRAFLTAKRLSSNQISMVCVASAGVGAIEPGIEGLMICDVPKPWPTYEWSKYQHYISPGGLEFERRIIAAIESASINFTVAPR
jgi:hypothetical protein